MKKRRRKTMIKQARLYVTIRKISLQRGEAVWPYIYREVLFIRPSLNEKKTNKGWNTIILKWLLLLLLHVPNSSPATSSCQISDHRRNCKRQISSKNILKNTCTYFARTHVAQTHTPKWTQHIDTWKILKQNTCTCPVQHDLRWKYPCYIG